MLRDDDGVEEQIAKLKGASETTASPSDGTPVDQALPLTDKEVEAKIKTLAAKPLVAYERERSTVAKELGMRASILDKLVAAERKDEDCGEGGQGRPLDLPEREPWPEPVNGAELLDAIVRELKRYMVMPPVSVTATALWVAAAYCFMAFYIFPRLFVTSPEKRCGKSTLLDVIEALVNRPLVASNIRSAALFRAIEGWRPTFLLDEADTFLRDDEDLRGVVNSGHKRNGSVVRCVGDDSEPHQFSTFAPMVIAGIGRQHETIEDRSITVALRRKRADEQVESFRPDRAQHLDRLGRMLARFAEDNRATLAAADPAVPDGIHNRMADNWRPLLAVADAAGGKWPEEARAIAETIAAESVGDDGSVKMALLSDIRDIFTAKQASGTDSLSSSDLVNALVSLEGRPWAEWKNGKSITTNGLARLLHPFGVSPGTIRVSREHTLKGYKRSQFADTFARYLRTTPSQTVTASQPAETSGFQPHQQPSQEKSCYGLKDAAKPQNSATCDGVTVETPLDDDEGGSWTE
jgi:putative DNA primase/helicase